MDSQNWTLWLVIASLVGMALFVPSAAMRRIVAMTRKMSGLPVLMRQAQQLAYLKLTPAWDTGKAIFVQAVLLLLGVGLLGAAAYEMSVSAAVAYGPIVLLGGSGLLCMVLLGIPLKKYREARRLDSAGVMATTSLLACFEGAEGDDTAFYVAYELPGVGPIRHAVAYRVFRRVNVGDPVTITYLPHHPRTFRPRWHS